MPNVKILSKLIANWLAGVTLVVLTLLVCVLWLWETKNVGKDSAIRLFYASATETGSEKSPAKDTVLIAVGDIMLSRDVEQKMIHEKNWQYPFLQTAEITSGGDIVFGNLESPLIAGPVVSTGEMSFRADPKAIDGLLSAGFNVLSLANNHIKNRGDDGIISTNTELDKSGIAHVGAGLNDVEAREPAIIEKNGTTFGFLAYTDSAFTPASYEAAANRSGSPFLNEDLLAEDIARLKTKTDVIIVSMHAGTEYQDIQNQKQIDFSHRAIELGASVVIGHHPHVVQPVEQYMGGYIFYSLGNFIFDQMWSEKTREGAIASITFNGIRPVQMKITPIKIYEFAQARPAEGESAMDILTRMNSFTK